MADLPGLYEGMATKIEAHATNEAELASGGDCDIYKTVYHSFDATIDFTHSVPDQSRGYILAAIYAFYERNVRLVFKELGIPDYQSQKMIAQNVFVLCNLQMATNQQLYDDILILGLIRNNISHGKLNNNDNWCKLNSYVSNNPYLEMEDDVVRINDNLFLMKSLATIVFFFEKVFEANPLFDSKRT